MTDKTLLPGLVATPERVMVVQAGSEKILAIADLHLCLEREATSGGVLLLPSPGIDIKKNIERVAKRHPAGTLLILGDIKHDFGRGGYDCYAEVRDFVSWASKMFPRVIVVRGNHDNYAIGMVERAGAEFHEHYYKHENLVFLHGHEPVKPERGVTIIMGHEHPAIELWDNIGTRERLPCYLHGQRREYNLVVLPASSPLAPGTDMLSVPRSELLSPLLRETGIDDLTPTAIHEDQLLDFPEIGKIKRAVGKQNPAYYR